MRPFFFLLSALLFSCTTIYYDQAQPINTESLKSFPIELRGDYLLDNDTFSVEELRYSFPIVHEKKYSKIEVKISPKLEIRDGLLYDETVPIKGGITFTEKNDSIYYTKRIRGYKALSDSLVLKKIGKYFVLSELEKDRPYWHAMLIEKRTDSLIIFFPGNFEGGGDSSPDENAPTESAENKGLFHSEIRNYEKITPFEKLSDNSYLIRPTKREFKKLIKKDFFKVQIELGPFEKIE